MFDRFICRAWRVALVVALTLLAGRLLLELRVHAQEQNPPARFDFAVRADFFAGMAGDKARFDKAMATCERALDANPADAEAMVWHGAGLFFSAGRAFAAGDAETGMTLSAKGQREMDAAVALAPDRIGVRIPRGAALLEGARRMPPELARPLLVKATEDYERTLQIQQGSWAKVGDHAKGELLFGLADGWSRLGDLAKARAYFEQLVTEAPDGARAEQARARLASGLTPNGPVARCSGCHN